MQCSKRLSNDIYSYYLNLDYKNYLKLKTSKIIYDATEAVEIFRGNLLNLSSFLLEIIVLIIIISNFTKSTFNIIYNFNSNFTFINFLLFFWKTKRLLGNRS